MTAVNGLMTLSLISSWYEKSIRAKRLKPHDLRKNIRCDRHPTLTTLREKIFLRPVDDSNISIADPIRSRTNDFYIAEADSRKKKVRDIGSRIFFRQFRCCCLHRT